jgi:hypothetical protein
MRHTCPVPLLAALVVGLVLTGPARAQDPAPDGFSPFVVEQLTTLESEIAAAESRWRSAFVGRLKRSGGPVPESDVLGPLESVRREAGDAAGDLQRLGERRTREGLPPDAFVDDLDRLMVRLLGLRWELSLDEARHAVVLAQQEYDEAVVRLDPLQRAAFGQGEAIARATATQQQRSIAGQLSRARDAVRAAAEVWRRRAEEACRLRTVRQLSEFIDAALNVTTPGEGARPPSALDRFLVDHEILAHGAPEEAPDRRLGMAAWFAPIDIDRDEPGRVENVLVLGRRIASAAPSRPGEQPGAPAPVDAALLRLFRPDVRFLFVYGEGLRSAIDSGVARASEDGTIRYRVLAEGSRRSLMNWLDVLGERFQPPRPGAPIRFGDDPTDVDRLWKFAWAELEARRGAAGAGGDDQLEAVLIRATLTAQTLPGPKVVALGEPTVDWYLDAGPISATIRWIRETAERGPRGERLVDRLTELVAGETVRVEVETSETVAVSEIELVVGRNGEPTTFGTEPFVKALRVPGESRRYLTPGIGVARLAQPGDLAVSAQPGDRLAVRLAPDGPLAGAPSATADVVLMSELNRMWTEALRDAAMAGKAAGKARPAWAQMTLQDWQQLAQEESGRVSRGGVEIPVLVGEHAAMLLLREQLKGTLGAYRELFPRMRDRQAMLGLVRTMRDELADPQSVLGRLEVTFPPRPAVRRPDEQMRALIDDVWRSVRRDPKPEIKAPLNAFFDRQFLQRHVQTERDPADADAPATLHAMIVMALWDYMDAVDHALRIAEGTDDKNLEGLIDLTGRGFEPIVEQVLPRLVRLDAGVGRLVPDDTARTHVRNVPKMAEQLRLGRAVRDRHVDTAIKIASVATLYLGLAALPVRFVAGMARLGAQSLAKSLEQTLARLYIASTAGAIGTSALEVTDLALRQIPEWTRQGDEIAFATGARAIIGPDRLAMAEVVRTPQWQRLLSLAAIGIGFKLDVMEAFRALRLVRETRRAEALLERVRRDGVDALEEMNTGDQRLVLGAIGAGLLSRARNQLPGSELERRALAAADVIAGDADNAFRRLGIRQRGSFYSRQMGQEALFAESALGTRVNVSDAVQDGRIVVGGQPADGDFLYVIDARGRMFIGANTGAIKHSSLMPVGEPVYGAGHIVLRNGRAESIDAVSGHYMHEDLLDGEEADNWILAMREWFAARRLPPPAKIDSGVPPSRVSKAPTPGPEAAPTPPPSPSSRGGTRTPVPYGSPDSGSHLCRAPLPPRGPPTGTLRGETIRDEALQLQPGQRIELPKPDAGPDLGTVEVGARVGNAGHYGVVYELPGHPGVLLKIIHKESGANSIRGQLAGRALLERGLRVPSAAILGHRIDDQGVSYLLVEDLRRLPGFKNYPQKAPVRFDEETSIALAELYRDIGRGGRVFADGHLGNIYFFREGGRLRAGVIDHDQMIDMADVAQRTGNLMYRAMQNSLPGDVRKQFFGMARTGDAEGIMRNLLESRFARKNLSPEELARAQRLSSPDVIDNIFKPQ